MSAESLPLFADPGTLRAIAARIDTGIANPETSRALIVFNPADTPASGIAVFDVDMRWRDGQPLPPLRLSRLVTGASCRSRITPPEFTASNGEAQKGRIHFQILFEVEEISATGWDTYIAEYLDTSATPDPARQLIDSTDSAVLDLKVFETTRHLGDLPPRSAVSSSSRSTP